MRKLRTRVMALGLAFALGVTTPAVLPSMNTTTVASAATVKLNQKKLSLKVGQTKQLKLTGARKSVTWSSSKKSVATVSKKGKVTAKAAGTTTITAKSDGKKYTCKVTVIARKADNKSDNKSYTLDNLTFNIPSSVTCESDKQGTLSMMSIGFTDEKKEGIIITNNNLEGQQITYDQWAEMVNATLDELATSTATSNYKKESVDTNLGKGICATFKLTGDGTVTMVAYEMYINDHSVEVVYTYDDTVSALELQATFDMIMKTIAVVK
jgi:hypothetical protein